MSCVARPHQTPIGTASNFLQCKWVSCSKSYWQGYDLAWYKDMEAPCFPQPNLWLARCASRSWAALRKFVVLSTQASKQQQAAASSRQEASKQQASSKQAASKPASKPASQQASQQASSKQQQAAASSSKQQQQQAAGKQQQASISKQAASKQQPAFAPLKEWTNISFKNQRLNFFQAHGPKTMKSFKY